MNTSLVQKRKTVRGSIYQFAVRIFKREFADANLARFTGELICGAIIVIILSVMTFLIINQIQWQNQPLVIQGDNHTKEELRERMEYHGILFAEEIDGVWMFERNGKKCRLFKEKP